MLLWRWRRCDEAWEPFTRWLSGGWSGQHRSAHAHHPPLAHARLISFTPRLGAALARHCNTRSPFIRVHSKDSENRGLPTCWRMRFRDYHNCRSGDGIGKTPKHTRTPTDLDPFKCDKHNRHQPPSTVSTSTGCFGE